MHKPNEPDAVHNLCPIRQSACFCFFPYKIILPNYPPRRVQRRSPWNLWNNFAFVIQPAPPPTVPPRPKLSTIAHTHNLFSNFSTFLRTPDFADCVLFDQLFFFFFCWPEQNSEFAVLWWARRPSV